MRKPDFFIVGAPKCGTTSMARYLRQHPDVFMAYGEPHFFSKDIRFNPRQLMEEGYLSYFSEAGNERRVGEKSVWYLYSKRAAAEIKKFCPHAKIIIQIRNPVDMLYSLHNHLIRKGSEDITDFEEALDAEQDRRKGFRIPKHVSFPERLFYSEIPLYTEQIKRYVNVFGWKQIHIVVFDDIVNNTSKVYRDVLRFLDVDEEFTPVFKVYNPAGQIKSQIVRYLIRNSWVSRVARIFLSSTTCRKVRLALSSWNFKSKPKPPMDRPVRKRLQRQFEQEVKRLSKLLGRDLSYWCRE